MNDRQYSITVTSGLMDMLDDAEIESVLGHELTHIRNGDVRLLVIAVIIAGVISFFAELGLPAAVSRADGAGARRSGGDGRKGARPGAGDRARADRGRLDSLDRHSFCAVAQT